jgi:hypothetical protein
MAVCLLSLPAQAKYGGGTGEPNDPYRITTAEDLKAIGNHEEHWDKNFILVNDVDLAGYTDTEMNIIGRLIKWNDPNNMPFTGLFDGGGHTIYNYNLSCAHVNGVGLFGFVDDPNAEIRDLELANPDIHGANKVGVLVGFLRAGCIKACYSHGGIVTGSSSVGGLVGESGAWFLPYPLEYDYSPPTIYDCYSTSRVMGQYGVGGIVGDNFGQVSCCYSNGNVLGNSSVGGLVGISQYIVSDCYSMSSVDANDRVGGLVGYNYGGTIYNCYSTGHVSANVFGGGLVGLSWSGRIYNNCFWDIESSGQEYSYGGVGKTLAQMRNRNTYVGWGGSSLWTIRHRKDYPRLWWENAPGETITNPDPAYGGGSGTPDYPYLIYTAEHLNTIGLIPCDFDKHFKLMADIDLKNLESFSFNIIGDSGIRFTGVFDGNGYTISNLVAFGQGRVGLFGAIDGPNAEVRDLGLVDPMVKVRPPSWTPSGPLVGTVYDGMVSDCYVNGGSVFGYLKLGGLVGSNDGLVFNCFSTAEVEGSGDYVGGVVGWNEGTISRSFGTGRISARQWVGGLVGLNHGTIENSYAMGSVSGTDYAVGGLVGVNGYNSSVATSYSTGTVSGTGDYVGGLVGDNFQASVTKSFWDVETSGQTTSDGGIGLTTAEMQTATTFLEAGCDFVGETENGTEDIWDICEGTNYPRFVWQIPVGDFVCPDGVTMLDFSLFAAHWLDDNCDVGNDYCEGTDLDLTGAVDVNDLEAFADNWLGGITP